MSSHLIIVLICISYAVFPILMVHHFLHTSFKPLQNVDFSEVGNMHFFQELYSHIDKNSGGKV